MSSWEMWAGRPRYSDELWCYASPSKQYVAAYGAEPERVVVTEDPDGEYYGWLHDVEWWSAQGYSRSADEHPVMVQPNDKLFRMQFTYGPDVEVEAGKGRIVRLRIEAA